MAIPEYKNRFEGVDLGTSATMRRQIQATVRNRSDVILEMALLLCEAGHEAAAEILRTQAENERKEIGL